MANNIPVGGGNVDFSGPVEALSALQRNWQIARKTVQGVTSTTFSASTLYGWVIDSGSITLTDYSSGGFLYKLTGPDSVAFSFGAPLQLPPPGGGVVATVSATTVNATLLYK